MSVKRVSITYSITTETKLSHDVLKKLERGINDALLAYRKDLKGTCFKVFSCKVSVLSIKRRGHTFITTRAAMAFKKRGKEPYTDDSIVTLLNISIFGEIDQKLSLVARELVNREVSSSVTPKGSTLRKLDFGFYCDFLKNVDLLDI